MSFNYGGVYGGGESGGGPHPDYDAAQSAVGRMSTEELRELLDEEQKCEQFVKTLHQIRALYSEKEMLMASNKSLAEYNLSQEAPLREAKVRLQEKHREAKRLAERVKTIRSQVEEKSAGGCVEPDTMLALLQAAGAEADEESETLADEFLRENSPDVNDFVKKFMEKRKLAHLRRIKIDKMKELLDDQRRKTPRSDQSQITPTRRAPPPPAAYNIPNAHNSWGAAAHPPPAPYSTTASSGSDLPYPIHPMGMPAMPTGPGY